MFYTVAMGESFGVWIREHRKKVKMTQLDVAKRCGLSYSYISTLERNQPHSLTGKPILPTRDKVALIAKAVNGDADEALALCGYASSVPQTRPQTIPELIEALEPRLRRTLANILVRFGEKIPPVSHSRRLRFLFIACLDLPPQLWQDAYHHLRE
jgi:transcriptional regulator with XRE-family HTH domain